MLKSIAAACTKKVARFVLGTTFRTLLHIDLLDLRRSLNHGVSREKDQDEDDDDQDKKQRTTQP